MNVVEKNLDAYQIAEYIFSDDKFTNKDLFTIENLSLIEYFEMLSIVFLEGMFKFCKHAINSNNKFNLNLLSLEDIYKLNSYLKKINIQLNFDIFNINEWLQNHKETFKKYDELEITSNTSLNELKNIFYVEDNVYIIYFSYTYS